MSTRSYIGIKNEDGSVRSIYHHFDGYIEGVGKVLYKYYKNADKINRLLDLGDMSMIGEQPVGYWDDFATDYSKCRTYKERGDEDADTLTYKNEKEFLEECCEDYTYLYKDGEWFVREGNNKLEPLKKYFK